MKINKGSDVLERYRALIGQLCRKFDIPEPGIMYQAAQLPVGDVNFTLFHGGLMVPDSVLVYCEFGVLPPQSRERMLLRLLETNAYLFGVNSPAFTYQADRNMIGLMCCFDLEEATLESTVELLEFFAGMARRWREDHFLFAIY
ncbi:CesT family type III secretion system chaperone [Duganella sp. LjRoot269]|jgi:hypothetical protein|uniref:CesT family type III secretion system chaperone n=1 Tax=Duganella sp. LjRoot269 TaxID=3342305 RepID=UPI003ECF9B85